MARPKKKGLDYFPLDTDIFTDDKLFDVQNEYGTLGEVIYLRLLCLVYKHGYYYQFDSKEKLAAMLIRSIGNRWINDKKTVIEVIDFLAKINLFSSELMQRNILTSRGVQERYLAATERRHSNIDEYSLLEKNNFKEGLKNVPETLISVTKNAVSVAETKDNVSNNATKESKVKKSKINERKEEETTEPTGSAPSPSHQQDLDKLVYDYGQAKVDEYVRRVQSWYADKGKPVGDLYATVRKWLEQDNVPIDDHEIDKYNIVINKF